jgi:hypothetical protein
MAVKRAKEVLVSVLCSRCARFFTTLDQKKYAADPIYIKFSRICCECITPADSEYVLSRTSIPVLQKELRYEAKR